MRPVRRARVLPVVLAVVVTLLTTAGCAGPAAPTPDRRTVASPSPSRTGAARPPFSRLHVAAVGDSVTAGAACGCDAFPALYGRLLGDRWEVPVVVDNDGVSGQDSGGLLAEVDRPGSATARTLASSDVVVVTIGANDFGDHHDDVARQGCLEECLGDEVEQMRRNVVELLARLRTLRAGRPTTVLVTGYWNVFEDGDVARRAFPGAGVRATVRLTEQANDALQSATTDARDTYVDLAAAFRSAGRSAGGVTRLLAPDGDHPSAAGHRLIAATLLAAGLPHLSPG